MKAFERFKDREEANDRDWLLHDKGKAFFELHDISFLALHYEATLWWESIGRPDWR